MGLSLNYEVTFHFPRIKQVYQSSTERTNELKAQDNKPLKVHHRKNPFQEGFTETDKSYHSLITIAVLCSWTINLHYVSRNVDKLVHQSLTVNLGQNSSLIVVPQSTTHRFVIHVWFVFMKSPEP